MRIGIRTKIILGYFLIIALTTLAIVGAHLYNNSKANPLKEKADLYNTAVNLGFRILVDIRSVESGIRSYLVDGDKRHLSNTGQDKQKLQEDLAAMKRLTAGIPGADRNTKDTLRPFIDFLTTIEEEIHRNKNPDLKILNEQFEERWTSFPQEELRFLDWFDSRHMEAMNQDDLLGKRTYIITLIFIFVVAFLARVY